jgi:sulfur carrier protein
MRITLNGQPELIPDGATAEDLVAQRGLTSTICAVEINKRLIPKNERAERVIRPEDRVEIVTLVGGG